MADKKRHGNYKDFCKRGHELAVHARIYYRASDGATQRQCRKCESIVRYVGSRQRYLAELAKHDKIGT